MSENEFYDDLETRDPEARERDLMAALSDQIDHAKASASYFGEALAEVDAAATNSREALAALPVTRKSDLVEHQAKSPPFGGMNGVPVGEAAYIYQSPGPIYEPGGHGDFWRMGRSFWAAGMRPGDIVHNTFSYHLTPAGRMMEGGAHALGCPVFPGGIGNTEQQIAAIAHLQPAAYAGTPSFLKILLEKSAEAGIKHAYRSAAVGGEALPPSLRSEINDHGVNVLQGYGTADLGLIAYESNAKEGMIIDENVIVEIVRPGSGDPVAAGEVGEVVVTVLAPTYPLIRFATGDLSAILAGQSPCGRTNQRIKGWMGRADQTTKVKGMFVHPAQVNQTVARHPEISKGRLVVDSTDGRDVMTLKCEVTAAGDDLAAAIAESIQSVCKLKGEVEFVDVGNLPNDGKVIDDIRTYE
jgi:phenylacetate-CoA ligase